MAIRLFGFALLFALSLAAVARAHHTHAMYEPELRVTLKGTATALHWSNPHVWLYMTMVDENGQSANWVLEGGAPVELTRQGWRGDKPAPGDAITVTIRPLKDGARGGLIRTIEFADGSQFGYVSPDTD